MRLWEVEESFHVRGLVILILLMILKIFLLISFLIHFYSKHQIYLKVIFFSLNLLYYLKYIPIVSK